MFIFVNLLIKMLESRSYFTGEINCKLPVLHCCVSYLTHVRLLTSEACKEGISLMHSAKAFVVKQGTIQERWLNHTTAVIGPF